MMHALKTLAFAYDSKEDRILSIVNLEHPQPWACWLTRRLTLGTLEETRKFIERTSAVTQKAAAEFRGEIAAFERDAAMARTAQAVKIIPWPNPQAASAVARRADQMTITCQADKFRLELKDSGGDAAGGMLGRAELQRILRMLQDQAHKAGWVTLSDSPQKPAEARAGAARGRVRH